MRWMGIVAVAVLALAGCGGEREAAPERPAGERSAEPDAAAPAGGVLRGGGPPDAGTLHGHGADAPARARVRVPEVDRTPPQTFLRVVGIGEGGGRVAARASSFEWPAAKHMNLGSPRVFVVARARDTGGMARVRISIEERVTCLGREHGRRTRLRLRYLPPPAIARIRVPPGAVIPAQLTRRARLVLGARLCGPGRRPTEVRGRLWADATNAHERESSGLVRYSFVTARAPR